MSATEEIAFSYKIREALGFGKLHSLSHLDDDARQMRVALTACAPLAYAAINAAGKDRLGYIGGADTESQEPVTVTIQTTLGALREARRALWVANIETPRGKCTDCGASLPLMFPCNEQHCPQRAALTSTHTTES